MKKKQHKLLDSVHTRKSFWILKFKTIIYIVRRLRVILMILIFLNLNSNLVSHCFSFTFFELFKEKLHIH